MKLFDPKNSLFGLLSRAPWWISFVVAAGLYGAIRPFFPPYAAFVAFPFACIGCYAAWRQFRARPPANAEELLARIRGMTWENFQGVASEAFRRSGYRVEAATGAADFVLRKDGRTTLACCRRWKMQQVGRQPLEELLREIERSDAHEVLFVSAGTFTPTALEFAKGRPIRLLAGAELAKLIDVIQRRGLTFFSR